MAYVSAIDSEVDKAIIADIRKETGVLLTGLPISPEIFTKHTSNTNTTTTTTTSTNPTTTNPKHINNVIEPNEDNSSTPILSPRFSLLRQRKVHKIKSTPYSHVNPKKTCQATVEPILTQPPPPPPPPTPPPPPPTAHLNGRTPAFEGNYENSNVIPERLSKASYMNVQVYPANREKDAVIIVRKYYAYRLY
jgi:hypothetical protein